MKTPLYDEHVAAKATLTDFFGFELPLRYTRALDEYQAVRNEAGVFDVSHMLRIDISGKDALAFLESISTNFINRPITYTMLTNESGGIVDDTLVYKIDDENLFIVANGSRREQDLNHLRQQAKKFQVTIQPRDEMILALQGPKSDKFLPPLKFHTFIEKEGLVIASSGYTGEKGYEVFGPKEKLVPLWREWIAKGVKPCGLEVRDILRLEMGYALYGHELSEQLRPIETVAKFVVKDKAYLGKTDEAPRYFPAALIVNQGVPREGYKIQIDNVEVGTVTSGGYSPALKKGIALALLNRPYNTGEKMQIKIRESLQDAVITTLPFLKK